MSSLVLFLIVGCVWLALGVGYILTRSAWFLVKGIPDNPPRMDVMVMGVWQASGIGIAIMFALWLICEWLKIT